VTSVAAVAVPQGRLPRAVLAAAVLGTALAYMSDDMLNLAVPSLAGDLGASVTGVQWILNGYYVPLVAFVLIAGSIGDILGHRRVFRFGLIGFSAGALLCAAAPTVAVLVAGRSLQGLAAAALLAAGLALVTTLAPPDTRNREVGAFLGLAAAVPALGPFISGALVDLLSWRWLFIVPLVLPLAALALTHRLVPETFREPGRRPDVRGALTALVALSALSVALILGPGSASRTAVLVAAGIAVVAGGAFARVEQRAADPLVRLEFFRRRRFLGGNAVWLLACLTCWGAVFFLAVTLQTTLGLRPLAAGLILTPIYLVMMIGSPVAGWLADRYGPTRPILLGLAVYTSGLWLLAGVHAGSSPGSVLARLAVFAIGMAAFTAPLATVTLSALDDTDQGVASGVNSAMGQLASLLGIIVLPAAAGLAGASTFGGHAFAAGYPRALHVAAALAATGLLIAAFTLRPGRPPGRRAEKAGPAGGVGSSDDWLHTGGRSALERQRGQGDRERAVGKDA
jgi:EmrB/QacA subfamily drug resistance transporter